MRRTLLIAFLALFSVICSAQNSGPLKFLGIPVDGTKNQFTTRLGSKGFVYNKYSEGYEGEFNGHNVNVYVHTHRGIVDRIYVAFRKTNEDNIKVEYNTLLRQFKNSDKYLDVRLNSQIPDDEDISYEITVNNKRYQACFVYYDSDRDPIEFMNKFFDRMSDFYSTEQQAFLKETIRKIFEAPEEERDALRAQIMTDMQTVFMSEIEGTEPDPEKAMAGLEAYLNTVEELADGQVWFMIHEDYGKYSIGLYYDNMNNRANGEDL